MSKKCQKNVKLSHRWASKGCQYIWSTAGKIWHERERARVSETRAQAAAAASRHQRGGRIRRNIHDLRREATQIQFLRERVMSLMAIDRAEKRTTMLEAQAYAALQPAQRAFLKTWPFWGLRKLRDWWKTEEGFGTRTNRRIRRLLAADRENKKKVKSTRNNSVAYVPRAELTTQLASGEFYDFPTSRLTIPATPPLGGAGWVSSRGSGVQS